MRPWLLAIPVVLPLFFPASAWAMSCQQILDALASGTAAVQVIAQIEQGPPPASDLSRCLWAAGAPASVIAAVDGYSPPRPDPRPTPTRAAPTRAAPPAIAPMASSPAPAPRPRPAPSPAAAIAPTASPPASARPRPPMHRPSAPPPPRDLPMSTTPPVDEDALMQNGFVDTSRDPWSTFSVDVDTGSYTMARRTLMAGHLPPRTAVRVEEFVNYLPYDYAPPHDGQPFGVSVEIAPSPFEDGLWYARIGVQGKRVSALDRKPVHLTFLVDTSGSMQSTDKIGFLKDALIRLTEELEDGDTVAIVAYAGSAGLVLPMTPISDRDTILGAIRRLETGGSTAMGAGIELAYAQALEVYRPGHVNRVILASDGDVNVGPTNHEALSMLIRGYAERGITLTTLGFGTGNYRDGLMEQVANDGDGNYYYIDSMREAERVLVERMTSTLEVIARDVKLQVEWFPSSVESYRLIGYENRDIADEDFRDDAVDAGEIGAGHQVTALYALRCPRTPRAPGQILVRHKAPGPDSPAVESRFPIDGDDVLHRWRDTSNSFRMATAAASFAEILRGSQHTRHVPLLAVEGLALDGLRPEYAEDAELLALIRRAQLFGTP